MRCRSGSVHAPVATDLKHRARLRHGATKASRFLTHLKRLRAPSEPLKRPSGRTSALASHRGPILYQLPASLRYDPARLATFLTALRRHWSRHRHAIEFRDASWYTTDVFALLAQYRVALCLHDKTEGPYQANPVGPFVYVRFHGPSGAYHGSYSPSDLREWAQRVRVWTRAGLDVYAYFNNDVGGMAPRNAAALVALVSGRK